MSATDIESARYFAEKAADCLIDARSGESVSNSERKTAAATCGVGYATLALFYQGEAAKVGE